MTFSADYFRRFNGIARLYGEVGLAHFLHAHICVIGIGGVGSWVAESLVRSGIGEITLIDMDEICISNSNRQIHTLKSTVGQSKAQAMTDRLQEINPECKIHLVEDFIQSDNFELYLGDKFHPKFDFIIDAIDSVKDKAALIAYCKRQKLKLITIGGAGGQIDPTQIEVKDLAKTIQDPLMAKVRERLKRIHHLNKDSKGKYGIFCVYSREQLRYPDASGAVCFEKNVAESAGKLNCSSGLGAISTVTATFGFIAVSVVLNYLAK